MHAKIALVIVWFGPFPFWMPAFLLSCRFNADMEWLIFSDAEPPPNLPENVKILPMDIETFNRRATQATGLEVRVKPAYAYKLCDLKILYGEIFREELEAFHFWGCCDMDIVWGDIRRFITPDILQSHEVITSRPRRIAGHFCLFRNAPAWNGLFRRIPDVARRVADNQRYRGTDEDGLTNLLQGYQRSRTRRLWTRLARGLPVPRTYWGPDLTTCGREQRLMLQSASLCLRWKKGRTYGAHGNELMYLHFHKLREKMKTIDFGCRDAPDEFTLSPAGIAAASR